MPAYGLWYQVVQHTDERFAAMERFAAILMYVLGGVAAAVGIKDLALHLEEGTGRPVPNSAKTTPELVWDSRTLLLVWLLHSS